MGTEITNQCDSKIVYGNNEGQVNKAQVKKEYYQFFNYNDPNAWPKDLESGEDLMEKYLFAAKRADISSPDGITKPDGYLSKKEFNTLLGYLSDKHKQFFPDNTISQLEKEIIKNDRIIPNTIEDNKSISNSERKTLKSLWNIATGGIITAGVGGVGVIIEKLATGALSSLLVPSAAAAGVGLAVSLIGLGGYYIYKNLLENKANEYNKNATHEVENSNINIEQKSEGV